MRSWLLRLVIAIFSAGWLVPLWMGIYLYLDFMNAEVWPRLAGRDPGNSFPYLRIASPCFTVAFIWLGIVVLLWAYRASGLVAGSRLGSTASN